LGGMYIEAMTMKLRTIFPVIALDRDRACRSDPPAGVFAGQCVHTERAGIPAECGSGARRRRAEAAGSETLSRVQRYDLRSGLPPSGSWKRNSPPRPGAGRRWSLPPRRFAHTVHIRVFDGEGFDTLLADTERPPGAPRAARAPPLGAEGYSYRLFTDSVSDGCTGWRR